MSEKFYQYNPIDFLRSEEEIRNFLSEVEVMGDEAAFEEAQNIADQVREKLKKQKITSPKYVNSRLASTLRIEDT